MGTDLRAHLEYNQTGNHWVSLSNWELIRDYDMYRLLANGRGEGAIFTPRGLPHDAGQDARRDWWWSRRKRYAAWRATSTLSPVPMPSKLWRVAGPSGQGSATVSSSTTRNTTMLRG